MKTFFDVTSNKRSLFVFLQTLETIFWSQTTFGAIFSRIFTDFVQIFRDIARIFGDFVQIFMDFAQIFKDFAQIFDQSKHMGLCLHPASYTTVLCTRESALSQTMIAF